MTATGRFIYRVLWWLILLNAVYPLPLLAADKEIDSTHFGLVISQIEIVGNEKTQRKWVLKWADIQPGQTLDRQQLERARQEILDTTLFKQVTLATELREDGSLWLTITLEEKYYTLLLPRLSRNADGDVKTGIQLRLDNLQGADRSLRMLFQHEDSSNGDDTESVRFQYDWPLYNEPYELRLQVGKSIENTVVSDFQNIVYTDFFLISAKRDWNLGAFDIPWELEAALVYENRSLDRPFPPSLQQGEAGKYNRIRLGLIYDDIHWERYRRFGRYYAVAVEHGFKEIGSDYDSTISRFELLGFRPLNRHDNLNYRVVFDVANNSPFNTPRFDIGGSSDLRGLDDFDGEGDARFFTNIEYIRGLRNYPLLRYGLFVDAGNIYDDFDDVDLTDLQYTVGASIRWKLESFVETDLFIDYGYDVERSNGKIYGGTSLLF